jgi:hypothetical protein
VSAKVAREALETWEAAAGERRFTVKVDKRPIDGALAEKQAEAAEAATLLLSLPWELFHDKTLICSRAIARSAFAAAFRTLSTAPRSQPSLPFGFC